jgi:hypothetical protein
MINADLFFILMGVSPNASSLLKNIPRSIRPITTPKKVAARFLSKGYAVEFYEFDDTFQRVAWFWGPGEFVIPTSPYSTVKTLEGVPLFKQNMAV